ncbi:MAG: DUF4157 domain-containing protein [Chitinophagaceae bacterium]
MSYSSRVYRQRNANTPEEGAKDAFSKRSDTDPDAEKDAFSKQSDTDPESATGIFQAKLSVNKPGDKYEKEADDVADSVTANSKDKPAVQRLSTPADDEKVGTNESRMEKDKQIQEKPAKEKKEEKDKKAEKQDENEKETNKDKLKKPGEEKEKKKGAGVQRKPDTGSESASASLSDKIQDNAGKGTSLQTGTLGEMNNSFGKDFSDVNVHNDTEAHQMNKELNAQAFTNGKDIYFNEGKYDPDSAEGKKLLAHELTHVVQQNKS